jgi:hypothetical protein
LADHKLARREGEEEENTAAAASSSSSSQGVPWAAPPTPPPPPSGLYAARDGTALSYAGVSLVAANRTAESATAYLRQPERALAPLRQATFQQYEVAIPLSTAADCLREVFKVAAEESAAAAANGTAGLANTTSTTGFFTAPLIRFVGPEDALLSYSNLDHGVSVFINAEDYLGSRSNGNGNAPFKRAIAVLRGGSPHCSGSRLHLGKAGWPEHGCWRGDEQYGDDRWCDFGCAVRLLDPTGKFADASDGDRWNWAGTGVVDDEDGCCDQQRGFLGREQPERCSCRVRHGRPRESCPPPPYY